MRRAKFVVAIHPGTTEQQSAMQAILTRYAPEPAAGNPFDGADWLVGLVTGSLGTSLAVVAVAWFGFATLTGRASLRRGGLVVLGCCILFGAPALARSLLDLGTAVSAGTAPLPPREIVVPPPPRPVNPNPFDPYAGASVPNGN